MQIESKTSHTSTHSTTNTFTQPNMAQQTTSFMTTTPSTATTGRMTTKQVNPVQVPQETSRKAHLESCMDVYQPVSQVCKPGESLALRKASTQWKDFCEQTPIDKARHFITIFWLL